MRRFRSRGWIRDVLKNRRVPIQARPSNVRHRHIGKWAGVRCIPLCVRLVEQCHILFYGIDGLRRVHGPRGEDHWLVGGILTNAGEVQDGRNTQRCQRVFIPDSRAH